MPDETLTADFQAWAWETAAGCWRFDVFREPHDEDGWVCRRDGRIRRAYADIIRHSPAWIPGSAIGCTRR